MRLAVLGPLSVVDDTGREAHLAGRARVLLAALALRANQVVPAEELAELVSGASPSGASSTLRSYMARLRTALGPAWAQRIVTSPPGYLCRADEDEVDVLAFEALCRRVGAAVQGGQWTEASDIAARAAALWRGVPLLDVPSQALRDAFVPRLEQLRLQLLEGQAEAGLRLGGHERLVQPLRELVAQHPLRERFHAQLMFALAYSGRRAEALAAYQDARTTLVAELGVEPGPDLRNLHERILAGDGIQPPPAPSGDQALKPPSATEAIRQLPAVAGNFTGRDAELTWLTGLAYRADPQAAGGTVVISAIDGMAGVGKTALAVHTAHRLADQFPDGQLFVDLHGYTQGHSPREPGDALGMLLRALEVPAQRIPDDIEERSALYRQRLAHRRTLIVLDNAANEAQVRPLLPGTPGSLVLVTSRKRLKGLHDAHILPLDVLPRPDALVLLRAMLTRVPTAADDAALEEIATLCGHLPLALRIAGALLRHRPAWTPQYLAGLLRDQQQRLAALTDGEHDLRAVFDLSYTALDEHRQLLLRRLALLPGPDLDAYGAAALLGLDPQAAAVLLEGLVDHNLLIAHAPGRYRLHDLIRAHARTLADHDPAKQQAAARGRLLDYYVHTAHTASIPLTRYPRSAPDSPVPVHAPALADPAAARSWLRAERDNLEAAHAHARGSGLDEHAVALAMGLSEIMRNDGPLGEAADMLRGAADTAERRGRPLAHLSALTDLGTTLRMTGDLPGSREVLTRAVEVCRRTGHRNGEAAALTELGFVTMITGDAAGSGDVLAQAVRIFQQIGNHPGEADALVDLGRVRRLNGDIPGSVDALTRALEICRQIGHRRSEAIALNELGAVRRMAGDLPGAEDAHRQALEIFRAIDHRAGEATALNQLGTVRRLNGDLPGADDALTQSLDISRQLGHRNGEAFALTELGRVRHMAADAPAATEALRRALDIFRTTGHRLNEAWALNHYAAAVAATGDLPGALVLYEQALAMNRELDKPDDEAAALEGLGRCHRATGDTDTSATHLHQALEIYQRLGMVSDADRVRGLLAESVAV